MWLVCGLGNPGPKYAGNRHNIGFMVAGALARAMGAEFRTGFKGVYAKGRLAGQDAVVLEPLTYMNLSGVSLGLAATFFKAAPETTIVIHDELDLAFGDVRLKVGGGHAGHNGLRSIFEHFGRDFARVRVGIGRPERGDPASHVLSDFDPVEAASLGDVVEAAAQAVTLAIQDGPRSAMNTVNQKKT